MKKNGVVILMLILLSGCSPLFYSPNTQNVPLISQKGETNLVLSGNGNQIELQGAYGFSKSIALQVNGGLFIPADLSNGNGGSGKFLELGAGYFKPIKKSFVFETYGLAGIGSMENHLPASATTLPKTYGDVSAGLFRIGIQPSFGYKSKYFSAALSSRLVNLSYYNVKGDLIFENINQTEKLNDNKSNFLLEPALTLKGGFEKIKLQLQMGYSFNLTHPDFRQNKSFLTAGINFNFK